MSWHANVSKGGNFSSNSSFGLAIAISGKPRGSRRDALFDNPMDAINPQVEEEEEECPFAPTELTRTVSKRLTFDSAARVGKKIEDWEKSSKAPSMLLDYSSDLDWPEQEPQQSQQFSREPGQEAQLKQKRKSIRKRGDKTKSRSDEGGRTPVLGRIPKGTRKALKKIPTWDNLQNGPPHQAHNIFGKGEDLEDPFTVAAKMMKLDTKMQKKNLGQLHIEQFELTDSGESTDSSCSPSPAKKRAGTLKASDVSFREKNAILSAERRVSEDSVEGKTESLEDISDDTQPSNNGDTPPTGKMVKHVTGGMNSMAETVHENEREQQRKGTNQGKETISYDEMKIDGASQRGDPPHLQQKSQELQESEMKRGKCRQADSDEQTTEWENYIEYLMDEEDPSKTTDKAKANAALVENNERTDNVIVETAQEDKTESSKLTTQRENFAANGKDVLQEQRKQWQEMMAAFGEIQKNLAAYAPVMTSTSNLSKDSQDFPTDATATGHAMHKRALPNEEKRNRATKRKVEKSKTGPRKKKAPPQKGSFVSQKHGRDCPPGNPRMQTNQSSRGEHSNTQGLESCIDSFCDEIQASFAKLRSSMKQSLGVLPARDSAPRHASNRHVPVQCNGPTSQAPRFDNFMGFQQAPLPSQLPLPVAATFGYDPRSDHYMEPSYLAASLPRVSHRFPRAPTAHLPQYAYPSDPRFVTGPALNEPASKRYVEGNRMAPTYPTVSFMHGYHAPAEMFASAHENNPPNGFFEESSPTAEDSDSDASFHLRSPKGSMA